MNQQSFPIAIHQKPTILEIFLITLVLSITFIPFIYGITTNKPLFCLSLIPGIISIKLFNVFTKNKFTLSKIIQKSTLISFSDNGIEVNQNQNNIAHKWCDLKEIEINIIAYRGKRYKNDNERIYDGIENTIEFIQNGQKLKYRFYIENENQYESIKEELHKTILPLLIELKNLKEEDSFSFQNNFRRYHNRHNNETEY